MGTASGTILGGRYPLCITPTGRFPRQGASPARHVAVVDTPYNPAEYRSLEEVSRQRLDEIEHFFVSYNQREGR
jgi:hypothetical protein